MSTPSCSFLFKEIFCCHSLISMTKGLGYLSSRKRRQFEFTGGKQLCGTGKVHPQALSIGDHFLSEPDLLPWAPRSVLP